MRMTGPYLSLRVITLETDKIGHEPAHEFVVARARARGLAGATVTRGIMGFGQSGRMHTSKMVNLSVDLPVVTELVDTEAAIRAFVAEIGEHLTAGVTILTPVEARVNRRGRADSGQADG